MAFIIPTDLVFFFNLVIKKGNNLIFELKKLFLPELQYRSEL